MAIKQSIHELIDQLKIERVKAKKSTKALYKDIEYSIEDRVTEEKNDSVIMMCNRLINKLGKILKDN